jgi:cephalosporin-C deacetylase-like acetyl esterase
MLHAAIFAIFALASIAALPEVAAAQANAPLLPPQSAASSAQDARSSARSGREQLDALLDLLAATYTAKRAASVAEIRTRAEAEARQGEVRKNLQGLLGEFPQPTPLNAQSLGETKGDGFRVRKVLFESQPNFPVTALLYLPDRQNWNAKLAAILMTPGHYFSGKANDAGMAALFARNGFIVLSYDPIGQGERLQYPDPNHPETSLASGATGEHGEASLQPILLGDTFARYEVWDAMRGIDYLSSLPEVDPRRIGAFGCSGGGTVTALAGALDTRIAAVGVACYITSFDALLPALGPQDAEQSSPRFLSSGLDFADLIELAAPRRYAVISTYSDMFPFAGARKTVSEARRFYAFFDPASAGTARADEGSPSQPPVPTGPAVNADTSNGVSPSAALQFITGPGRHAALGPITVQILGFFIRILEPGADPDHPILAASPGDESAEAAAAFPNLPKNAFQVTPTGQVATSYPNSETVFSLNRKRADALIPAKRSALSRADLAQAIRSATGAQANPDISHINGEPSSLSSGPFEISTGDGIHLHGDIAIPSEAGRHPAVLFLVPDSIHGESPIAQANLARLNALVADGNVVIAVTPRPSPPGSDDSKASVLGPFYLLSLRADLVGKTILGMRVDDAIQAIDVLSRRPDVNPSRISAIASGHLGLVLLHAAVLDHRLRHIAIDHVLTSYRSVVDAPLPIGAPEDVVPGVLLHYDIPDLVRVLGRRVTVVNPLDGPKDLSQFSNPIDSLAAPRH